MTLKTEQLIERLQENVAGDPAAVNDALRQLIDFAGEQVGILDTTDGVDLAAFLNRRKAQMETVAADAKAAVGDDLDDGDEVHGKQWLIRCTLSQPNVFNQKRFKAAQPSLYDAFCEPAPRYSRTFGAV